MAEWSIAADCKSADFGLRGFDSLSTHSDYYGCRCSSVSAKRRIKSEHYNINAWVAQLVEHIHGKDEVTGSIPVPGSKFINNNIFKIMARDNIVKMKCEVCKNINYFTARNKKKIKEKLEMKKHCPKCKKHTVHKEMK